jgi:hypothetical protein
MYNNDPPSPPYNYFFDTQKEALNFAKRAKDKHGVKCEVVSSGDRWLLTGNK